MADITQEVEDLRGLAISNAGVKKSVVLPKGQGRHVPPQGQVKLDEKKLEVREEQHEKIGPEKIVGVQPVSWEEKLVKDLTFDKIDEMSAMLDVNSTVVKNWYYLAVLLGFKEGEINAMRRDGTGGGHPAKDFLINFQSANQEETVAKFIEKFKKMKRNDIKKFLENKVTKNTKICELPPEVRDQLAEMLTCRGGIVKDWKYLASLCDYGHEDIQDIASKKADDAQYSPTQALFQKIRASKPELKLGDLADILGEKMSRWDVVNKLKSFQYN